VPYPASAAGRSFFGADRLGGIASPGIAILEPPYDSKLLLALSDVGNPINRNPLHVTSERCGRTKYLLIHGGGHCGDGVAKAQIPQGIGIASRQVHNTRILIVIHS
jgi:hypothetical protein